MDNKRVRTALISVYHKEGLEILLDALRRLDVKILSTGGTYDWMEKQGYSAVKIEDLTRRSGKNSSPQGVRRYTGASIAGV